MFERRPLLPSGEKMPEGQMRGYFLLRRASRPLIRRDAPPSPRGGEEEVEGAASPFSPASGEKVADRPDEGQGPLYLRASKVLPLTLALSPQAGRGDDGASPGAASTRKND